MHRLERFGRLLVPSLVAASASACGSSETTAPEGGAVYRVGPGETYDTLGAVASRLQPGDLVEVVGGYTYVGSVTFSKSGEPDRKITVRGLRSAEGARPVLSGGEDTVHLAGDHFVFEGFEITGGSFRCIFHQANDVTVRDTLVQGCPGHGILGADRGAGSLTLEHVEVRHSGAGETLHPIYVATDEEKYPGATFRMQHSYVHDNAGGNSVKSRAERNEIYYNWLEGAPFYELDLIGPEEYPIGLRREDSDVVGNVLRKTAQGGGARIGGDGNGGTRGRYRFVNNTFLMGTTGGAVLRIDESIDAVELHNNVFSWDAGGSGRLVSDEDAEGVPVFSATRNWVWDGAAIPEGWVDTTSGADPGFTDPAGLDLTPADGSPLVDRGGSPGSAAGHELPEPLGAPEFLPPPAAIQIPARARSIDVTIDLGAFERP